MAREPCPGSQGPTALPRRRIGHREPGPAGGGTLARGAHGGGGRGPVGAAGSAPARRRLPDAGQGPRGDRVRTSRRAAAARTRDGSAGRGGRGRRRVPGHRRPRESAGRTACGPGHPAVEGITALRARAHRGGARLPGELDRAADEPLVRHDPPRPDVRRESGTGARGIGTHPQCLHGHGHGSAAAAPGSDQPAATHGSPSGHPCLTSHGGGGPGVRDGTPGAGGAPVRGPAGAQPARRGRRGPPGGRAHRGRRPEHSRGRRVRGPGAAQRFRAVTQAVPVHPRVPARALARGVVVGARGQRRAHRTGVGGVRVHPGTARGAVRVHPAAYGHRRQHG